MDILIAMFLVSWAVVEAVILPSESWLAVSVALETALRCAICVAAVPFFLLGFVLLALMVSTAIAASHIGQWEGHDAEPI